LRTHAIPERLRGMFTTRRYTNPRFPLPLHCGNRECRLFCSCDLDLDSMTFVYELDPYSLEIYRLCKYELPTFRLSKVIVSQTDTAEIIYHAASRVVKYQIYGRLSDLANHDYCNATHAAEVPV